MRATIDLFGVSTSLFPGAFALPLQTMPLDALLDLQRAIRL